MGNQKTSRKERCGRKQFHARGHCMPALLMVFTLITVMLVRVPAAEQINNDTDQPYQNCISGRLWVDENGDGILDENEKPLAGFTVHLYQEGNAEDPLYSVQTDEDGSYRMNNLEPGHYFAGITSGFVGTQEYLLPLCGITKNNAFEIDEGYEHAYTEVLDVKEDSIIQNLNGGLRRPAGIVPLSGSYHVTYTSSGTLIGTYPTLAQAVASCRTTEPCTITALTDDAAIGSTVTIPSNKTITLTSSQAAPVSLTQTMTTENADRTDGRHLVVDGTLTLEYISLSGTGLDSGNRYNGGVTVSSGGKLIMQEGAVIEKCYNHMGGGVYNSGTVTIEAGEIRNNKAVRLSGSGGSGGNGGGVANTISGARLTISGGRVTSNYSDSSGGGVYVGGGTVTISEGEISENTGNVGGGLYLHGTTARLVMTGGAIRGNISKGLGGGIFLLGYNSLNISGGVLSGNSAKEGGGIYTADNSYQDPADTSKYSNLTISNDVIFTANSVTQTYAPPDNYMDFTKFNGLLLNNNDINYQSPYTHYYLITYLSNNEKAETYTKMVKGTAIPLSATLLSASDAGFTPSDNQYLREWNTENDGNGTAYQAGDQVSLNGPITLYAIWMSPTLYIEKKLASISDTEESFFYYVESRPSTGDPVNKSFYASLMIPPGDPSAVIQLDRLEPGIYTVTELGSNWRYELNTTLSSKQQEISLTSGNNYTGTAFYQSQRVRNSWLSEGNRVTNTMRKNF